MRESVMLVWDLSTKSSPGIVQLSWRARDKKPETISPNGSLYLWNKTFSFLDQIIIGTRVFPLTQTVSMQLESHLFESF